VAKSLEGWVAKSVACQLATAALSVRIQTSLLNRRHKQRSGRHTLARQKNIEKSISSNSAVLRIRDNLVRIRICGFVPMTNRSECQQVMVFRTCLMAWLTLGASGSWLWRTVSCLKPAASPLVKILGWRCYTSPCLQ
jgi:hypothetical protein